MVVLDLHCQPGARKTQWMGWHGGRPKLQLKAPPVDGAANQLLIEFVADWLQVPKSKVRLVSGLHSRIKRLEIEGISDAQAWALLPPKP